MVEGFNEMKEMNRFLKHGAILLTMLVGVGFSSVLLAATNTIPLAQQPLLTTTQEPPNILFMIDNSGSMSTDVPDSGGQSRLEVAQDAVNDLLNSLTNVRVGLATFNGSIFSSSTGARIRVGVDDIANNKNTMINAVNAISAGGGTPLSSTQWQIGRYFVQGSNNTLTLHPGQVTQNTKSAYTIFPNTPTYNFGVVQSSPIESYCQKSFVILLTDGEPTGDTQPSASSGLTDYIGPCPATLTAAGVQCGLANVAAAMFDMDLRPDLVSPTQGNPGVPAKKNNVITYTIGFNGITAAGEELLVLTAENAGGVYLSAQNSSELVAAFQTITSSILYQSVSAASIAFNGSNLTANSAIYQPQYTTTRWSGALFKYPVSANGTIGAAQWDAGNLLNQVPYQNRLVFTYNKDTNFAVLFKTIDELSAAQQCDLNLNNQGSSCASDPRGQKRINYLLGDRSNEQTTSDTSKPFRQRDSVLGDIVNSTPVFVGAATAPWTDAAPFPSTSGQTYSTFKTGTAASRTPMVYVGANDGMLHGFNANTGQEVMAYVPYMLSDDFVAGRPSGGAGITLGIHYYTAPNYSHRFYVDGTPAIQDVYVKATPSGSAAWRTVLVGGLQSGGKGYYALDVTNPANFTQANIDNVFLWEFSSRDNSSLGYSYSNPQLALMNNGRWAAIFGNGYNATGSDNAKLFIVYLDGGLDGTWTLGTDYLVIDTMSGKATAADTPNGLGTPAAVDLDGNGTVDRIYAGDLNGDLWAFDVSSSSSSSWGTAYGTSGSPIPLYSGIATQPITAQPVVSKNPLVSDSATNAPNVLVMVGTGQFLSNNDKSNTNTQAFYGIWDSGTSNLTTSNLVQQTFTTSGTNRIMTNNSVPYGDSGSGQKFGWYIQFTGGERIIFPGSVIQARIGFNQFEAELLFSTFIPNTSATCSYGGSGFAMIVKVENGGQPSAPVIDVNNDSQINNLDNVSNNVVSGVAIIGGVPAQPVIRGDYLFIPTSSGTVLKIKIANTGLPIGRISWEMLKQT
jgi:type IV pilus assembly protein PilY1